MPTLVKFDVQQLPALTVAGRAVRVRMADEMDDPVTDLWSRCHGDGTIDELDELDRFDDAHVGWMGDYDAKTQSFVYLAGVLLAPGATAPAGFDVRTIEPCRVAVGWVQGSPDELVPVAQELTEKAMTETGLQPDDGAGWAMELYTRPRWHTPAATGEVVLDFYVPCQDAEPALG